ncbi:MAG: sodium:solute symporter [Streptosporangiales bacterium]|nr:sodium:solute symporter [Streptosporangiales bacterium]
MVDYIVIVAYFAGMLAVGWWSMRRAGNAEDYLVAGRRLGPTLYFGTLSAVVLGGASTIGGIGLGYSYGLSGMWLVVILGLGIVALSALFARRLTRLGVYTVSEMLELRYNVSARFISGLVMAAYDLMLTVTSTIAIGTIFHGILGIPRVPAIILGGGIVLVYCLLGGMWSVTLTDLAQFAIMTLGVFLVLLPTSLARAGGFGGLREALPASYFDLGSIGGATIFTYVLIYFFGILIGQDIWQRVFTARSDRVAVRGGVISGLYCMAYGIAGALIGSSAKVLYPNLQVADDAFATITRGVLPTGIMGLVLAAALAAIMSTASAGLMASATLTANDIYARFVAHRASVSTVASIRVFVLVIGVVAIAIACVVQDIVAALTVAYNLLVGGLLVPILGGLVWRRSTASGALAAAVVGSVTVVVLMIVQGLLANEPIYFGLIASAVAFVVGSLVTRPTPAEALAAWDRRLRGESQPAPPASPTP